MPTHMNPIEPAAEDAILVGDPRRAFALAQELIVQPKMTHLARGLWGYTGVSLIERPLTVQSTGIGGPSAVAVIGDLAEQGTRRIVRLGSCLSLKRGLDAGDLILVGNAHIADGAASSLTGGARSVGPDPGLFKELEGIGPVADISSHDLVSRRDGAHPDLDMAGQVVARDLQTAATLAIAERLDLSAAALLIVSEDPSGRRLDEEELWKVSRMTGRAVLERLGRSENVETGKTNPLLEG